MAYNLESLIQILDHQILHPHPLQPWILDPHSKPQIESLLHKARFLNELFENAPAMATDRIWSLETLIRDAAYEAEDVIESHLVDRLLSRKNNGQKLMISPPDLQQVINKFDLAEKEMIDATQISEETTSVAAVSSRDDPNPNNILEGLSNDLIQLKDWLTSQQSKLEIMPIVGMGGIGKTTLARNLYNDALILSRFDIRAWITISQEYDLREILTGLLQCVMGKLPHELVEQEEEEDKLVLHLYQSLKGRRFLIVLDDMWASKAWDCIKMCFPDDKNGSRIVVTTRELSVANYAGSENLCHQMNFLSGNESWNLLRTKVFGRDSCPPKLEQVGRTIAKGCAGLPLAVHVLGGFLAQLARTPDSWAHLAYDSGSAVVNKDELVSNVLSLSYTYLPNHLKPFFLYMGAFREDREILSSKLIRQCVAEGFVRPILGKSSEEAARLYLKALVDRNLLLVHRQEIKGKVKSYSMHDLLRELSIKKAQDEKFLQTLPSEDMKNLRRLSAHSYYHLKQMRTNLPLPARSFIYTGGSRHGRRSKLRWFDISRSQLLRVFDAFHLTTLCYASEQVQKLVNARYLGTPMFLHLPCSVSNLCNLQTLILHTSSEEPIFSACELLNLPCLRHIKFSGIYPLFDIPHGRDVSVQEDLQTFSSVKIDDSFPKVLKAMPNLEKLGIFVAESMPISCSIDLRDLAKLENLKCSSNNSAMRSPFLTFLIFPPSLKKLTLKECKIPLGYLEIIGVLPNLEILKLQRSTLESSTWEPTEEGFRHLRLLLLEGLNLVCWIADESHYPRLERLVIQDCSQLEEIPSEIGDICTLEMIEVHGYSSPSALASARKIQDEQLEFENNLLQVRISASSL